MWAAIKCCLFGHTWGPVIEHAEWWHAIEEVGEMGGYRMGLERCGPNDEDAFLKEWADRTCTCCGAVKKED